MENNEASNSEDRPGKIGAGTKRQLEKLCEKYNPSYFKYVSQVLPNAYGWAKQCDVALYENGELKIVRGYAKKAPYGSATKFLIRVSEEHIDALKENGWRLINRARGELVR